MRLEKNEDLKKTSTSRTSTTESQTSEETQVTWKITRNKQDKDVNKIEYKHPTILINIQNKRIVFQTFSNGWTNTVLNTISAHNVLFKTRVCGREL